mgnify:CR=1 FL=1
MEIETLFAIARNAAGGTLKSIPYQPLFSVSSITRLYLIKQALQQRRLHGKNLMQPVRN